jgi:hypothetical protein
MEEGEGFVMHELGVEKVDDWRKIGTYLADRRDHLDLYRRMSDSWPPAKRRGATGQRVRAKRGCLVP